MFYNFSPNFVKLNFSVLLHLRDLKSSVKLKFKSIKLYSSDHYVCLVCRNEVYGVAVRDVAQICCLVGSSDTVGTAGS